MILMIRFQLKIVNRGHLLHTKRVIATAIPQPVSMTLFSFILFSVVKSRFFHHVIQEVLYFVTCIYHGQPEYAIRRNLQHVATFFNGRRIHSRKDTRHDIKVFLIDRCGRFHVPVLTTLYDGIHFFADNM